MRSQRYAAVIRLRPEKEQQYRDLHADAWPDVLRTLSVANIRNYSIFLRDGFLFSYFEYVGDDFDADMARMAADPVTRQWWELTDPCQRPVDTAEPGQWWAPMTEVFHHD
ncbi:MAG TPA: L-rhamnose mutarotase [Actinokineospora sp.]|jgi:L-rhamnose mutarotase|nr:L-rhamnose mutarotase [Actinokineospora sp.]